MKVNFENVVKTKINWGKIYEVIDTSFFAATRIFLSEFSDECKNYPNKPQFLPSEVKMDLKRTAI